MGDEAVCSEWTLPRRRDNRRRSFSVGAVMCRTAATEKRSSGGVVVASHMSRPFRVANASSVVFVSKTLLIAVPLSYDWMYGVLWRSTSWSIFSNVVPLNL